MKPKYIIGTVIILVFAIWGASAFFKTTVRYVSFAEARTATRTVQVAGNIDFDDVVYDAEKNRLVFSIFEMEAGGRETSDKLRVIYEGVVPGNFDQATSVLVRGMYGEEGFYAEKLLVKCPSKYQGLAEESQG
jgi:cytochrome c-type biogenesis protein CcmE